MQSIGKKTFSGASLMVLLRMMVKSLGLINTIILARLLAPADFGLVALVMAIFALIEIINAFGFDMVLIQNHKSTKEHYDTCWTLKVIFGLISALIICLLAVPAASFYNDARIINITYAVSFMFIFNGLVNIGVVEFRKQLDFKREFIYLLSIKLSTVILTICLAFYLKSYWALVYGMLFSSLVELCFSYLYSSYRPRFCLVKTKEIFSFSAWLLASNLFTFLNIKTKDFIIGKLSGPSYVGLYSVGDEIASLPSTEMIAPINRATFPAYSKVKGNQSELTKLYLQTLQFISSISIPACIGISAVSATFVPVILGDKWLEIIPIIQIITLADLFISLNTNASYLYIVYGKPKLSTFLLMLRISILIPTMIYLTNAYGYVGAAYSVLLTSLIMFPVYILFTSKFLNVSIFKIISCFIRPGIASIVMYYILMLISPETHTLINLVGLILAGMVVYVIMLLSLWTIQGKPYGLEQELVKRVARFVR